MSTHEIEKMVSEFLKYKRIREEAEKIEKELSGRILDNMTGSELILTEYKVKRIDCHREDIIKKAALADFPELNNEKYIKVSEYSYLRVS